MMPCAGYTNKAYCLACLKNVPRPRAVLNTPRDRSPSHCEAGGIDGAAGFIDSTIQEPVISQRTRPTVRHTCRRCFKRLSSATAASTLLLLLSQSMVESMLLEPKQEPCPCPEQPDIDKYDKPFQVVTSCLQQSEKPESNQRPRDACGVQVYPVSLQSPALPAELSSDTCPHILPSQ